MINGSGAAAPTLTAIDCLHCTVLMARTLVSAGRQIDLAGLDAEAAGLCAAVTRMPRTTARRLRPALEALAREVDELTAVLPPP
jgi:hypothetical protein